MLKKIIALIATMVVGAVVLTGCSPSSDLTAEQASCYAYTKDGECFTEAEYIEYYNTERRETNYVTFSRGDIITKVTAPGGDVVFEGDWKESDKWEINYLVDNSIVVQIARDAILTTPNGTYDGETRVDVRMSADKLEQLVEAYNALIQDGAEFEPQPTGLTMSQALSRTIGRSELTGSLQFTTDDQGKDRASAILREAYANGLPAWQVAQGSEGYDWDNEYAYDFRGCRTYADVKAGDNAALFAQWSKDVLPELEFTFAVSSDPYESMGGTKYLRDGGSFYAKSDIPCDIKRIDSEGNLVPLAETDYPDRSDAYMDEEISDNYEY